jgi:cytoskeleton protein RodZ
MESLGTYLKSAREKKKVTLEQIARDSRISLHQLKSLEEGRYGELPGGMYNRAFLRTYCEYVGIDPAEGIARYEAESAPPKEKVAKAKPKIPPPHSPLKPHPLVVWSVMLLVSVTGLYFSRKWIAAVFSPYFSHPAPPRMIADSTAPASIPTTSVRVPATAIPAPPKTAETTSVRAGDLSSSPPPGIASSAPPPSGTIRLEFEVLQECWVSVKRDGSRVLVKILEPGDDRSFNATEQFYLVLGNAAGVRLKINGQQVRPLGKSGEVVRVLINVQNIKDLVEKSTG